MNTSFGSHLPRFFRLLSEPPSSGDWGVAEGPTRFAPDSLWEYLNGGAPRYEAYGFERLIHVRYQLGDDPLASINLTEDGYARLTSIACEIAEQYCDGRLVSVLEGGYHLGSLANCTSSHLNVLMNNC